MYPIDSDDTKKAGTKLWIASVIGVGNTCKIEHRFQAKDYPFQLLGNELEKVEQYITIIDIKGGWSNVRILS